ncbi:acetate kinase [candidate division GN15 bacterium]|uniref:Acetate kinase n=1 Tax=candidate division GN15 bacterium TaxID=2072418 RepID=A0A855XC28_9BACT|nr:MAG: acetate kinase [candidate division GN15 bacterium]
MKILVLNCGSSSVKYQLINTETQVAMAKGLVSRIGMADSVLTHKPWDRPEIKVSAEILDHIAAIEFVVSMLLSPNHGVIKDKSEIEAVGHRVVHGGEEFKDSVLITPELMSHLRALIELAPLHNPHNIRGINACQKTLPNIPQVAVFDTAFHCNMPTHAFIYGIPYLFYKRYGIRRYGFHGTSHKFVSDRAAAMLGKPLKDLKLITCHLGNGASVAAVNCGVSIDTSMGFTPLEGLLMGTRSGDLDPAIILHIMAREELSLHEGNTMLNKHSGLAGISGVSSDMREIIDAANKGNENSKLALEVYCYRLKKYIGAYVAALGGVDAIVFTAGVGENSAPVRSLTCQGMEFFGISINEEKNKVAVSKEMDISADGAKVRTLVVPTNEELVIAIDTQRLAKGN